MFILNPILKTAALILSFSSSVTVLSTCKTLLSGFTASPQYLDKGCVRGIPFSYSNAEDYVNLLMFSIDFWFWIFVFMILIERITNGKFSLTGEGINEVLNNNTAYLAFSILTYLLFVVAIYYLSVS